MSKGRKVFCFFVLVGLLWVFGFGDSLAQETGIGVSRAYIEIAENTDWPYTVPITVTNFSLEREQFEVLLDFQYAAGVAASPARFSLEGGKSGRVLVTFEGQQGLQNGLIKIVSKKVSEQGFVTGTGIKIPVRIVQSEGEEKFLASAKESAGGFFAGGFSYIFGAGILLVSLMLLWHIAHMVQAWMPAKVLRQEKNPKQK